MECPLSLRAAAWPLERLPEALSELTSRCRLTAESSGVAPAPVADHEVADWIEQAALRAGCEVEPLATTRAALPDELARAYPALLRISDGAYLAILHVKDTAVHLLTPDLKRQSVPLAAVCDCLRNSSEIPLQAGVEGILEECGIRARKAEMVMAVLLEGKLANKLFDGCWILTTHPGAASLPLLKQAGVIQNGVLMVVAHTLQYLLWLGAWALLGSLSLQGHVDRGWIWGWVLLLFTMIPCQVMTTWLQGLFATGLGGFVKRRLLSGALKLRPDEMRAGGIGSFLGQALEAEALEALSLSGGIAGVLAVVEIVLAMCILGRFAILLLLWGSFTGFAAWRFLRRYEQWTSVRMSMTEDLVETMVGHRTRLAQLNPADWHEGEDQVLHGYLASSQRVDASGTWLIAAIPRGWLLTGLACLLPSIANRQSVDSGIALLLGGILLAYGALRKLTAAFADLAAARVAFERIRPLFQAAARSEKLGEASVPARRYAASPVLEAERVSYRHRPAGKLTVQAASLTVFANDRILLEGPSGGGKTTFASMLAGIRVPETGLLLAGGLDYETLGDHRWRRRIAAVPQFHENHILTETLAFNLLLGRRWPPYRSDLQQAEAVCRDLGLGNLIDSMPGGLMQMVGEGGWQLSHGERSRVFLARALLQSAEMVILDESFAALDPETAERCLRTTIDQAPALMVIAHP